MKMKMKAFVFFAAAVCALCTSAEDAPQSETLLVSHHDSLSKRATKTSSSDQGATLSENENDNDDEVHSATGWIENIVSDQFSNTNGHRKFTVFHLIDDKTNRDLANGYSERFLREYSSTNGKSALLLDGGVTTTTSISDFDNNNYFNVDIPTGALVALKYRVFTNESEKSGNDTRVKRYDASETFHVMSHEVLYNPSDVETIAKDEECKKKKKKNHQRDSTALGSIDVAHRRLLVIIGNFRGYSDISCSPNAVYNTVFGEGEDSVVSYFHNHTNGKHDFTRDTRGTGGRDVVGPYTITINKDNGCASGTWASLLLEAARNDGVNIEYYQHRMYIIPKTEVKNQTKKAKLQHTFFL